MRLSSLTAISLIVGCSVAFANPFYGVMPTGGAHDAGYIYEVTPAPHRKIEHLYDFCAEEIDGVCYDGKHPVGGLYVSSDGAEIIGATSHGGGKGTGTIYSLKLDLSTHMWAYNKALDFCVTYLCDDGLRPNGGLIRQDNGWIWGSADNADKSHGVVFEIWPREDGSFQFGPIRFFR